VGFSGLVWGLPPGDLATWVGSVAVALSFAVLAYGTLRQGRESARQAYLDESAQARLVGATARLSSVEAGTEISADVVNASELAVRQVTVWVLPSIPDSQWVRLPGFDVMQPGHQSTTITVPEYAPAVALILLFTDDAGMVWRKYDMNHRGRVTRIRRNQKHMHGLLSTWQRDKFRRISRRSGRFRRRPQGEPASQEQTD
jgi:hypothetical protein